MNGWSSHSSDDRWGDEPAWVYEITWEWEPLVGQRYPGDPGRRRAVHTPVYEASRGEDRGVGQAPSGAAGGPAAASWAGREEQPPMRYAQEPVKRADGPTYDARVPQA